VLHKRIVLKEIPIFNKVTMQYFFESFKDEPSTLIFVKQSQIFSFNFDEEEIKTLHEFEIALENQPLFFCSNHSQEIFCLATENQVIQV